METTSPMRPRLDPVADAFDLIIRSGSVVDGTGRSAFQADVGISGGRVRAIGDLGQASAGDEIDASGLTVAPGFIDVHSHSDFTLAVDGRAQSALAQGVTTELVGNCGHGCSPMRQENPAFAANIFGYESVIPLDWRTTADYLDRLERARPAVNVGTLMTLGNLRLAAMTNPEKTASPDERRDMLRLLEEGLDAGAFGLSVGLQYADSVETHVDEVIELTRAVASHGGLFASCVRYSDERAVEGITEAIETGRATGAKVQVSHAMPQPGSPAGMFDTTFELVESARNDGIDTAVDMHTRPFGELNLSAALPVWAVDGDAEAIRARLLDPESRARIKAYPSYVRRFFRAPGPEHMTVAKVRDERLLGRSLTDLTAAGGDPLDPVLDILVDEVEDIHRPLLMIDLYTEDDMARFYQHPLCAIASDATSLSPDGVLGHAIFHGAYTWAAWFLRRIVRERQALSLEEAIRHLTGLPAERMGLVDRGLLREGAWADVAIFDPSRIAERGTFEAPSRLAVGVEHVIVNGVPAWRGAQPTDARPGAVLRASQVR
jgi:N-acyl-D-aspartate/D-glutamate deacylase